MEEVTKRFFNSLIERKDKDSKNIGEEERKKEKKGFI